MPFFAMLRMGACLLFLLPSASFAVKANMEASANPVRKVVSLLQKMQKKIEKEAELEQELFDKFMCYCKTGSGDLSKSIADAEDRLPTLESEGKSDIEEKAKLDEEIKQAKSDRADAKEAMAEATALREKEKDDFDATKADYVANIDAIMKAVAALEKGMAGAFLQTDAARVLKAIATKNKQDLADGDRDEILSFLSSSEGSEYAPQAGEITGMLKQMGDEMAAALKKATEVEDKAVSNYEQLMGAKTKEVNALTKAIETKTQRSGELAVSVAQIQNDIEDTKEGLAQDKKFLVELEKSCSTKEKEWDERCKVRQDELVALADTIKILNDDDALELFKKTLPAPGAASFMQVQISEPAMRQQARAILKKAPRSGSVAFAAFIVQALHGKKISFDKVTKMIDEMIKTLGEEQKDDDSKKQYCEVELDKSDDKKKALERSIKDSTTAIEAAKEGIAMTTEEIAALIKGIKALDKSVAEATTQRQEENAEYKELMANDGAAKELLKLAMNRLNKFYNPKLYQPPAKKERSAMDAISEDVSFVQVSADESSDAAPPPPPETFDAYQKKTEESGGVIQMINLLITDLEKEMVEAEVEEKNAQQDYEELMVDAAKKRAKDSKTLAGKEATKADLEEDLQAHKQAKKDSTKELMEVEKYIMSLHTECDFLLKYYDVRKTMRAQEVDALGKANAVLAGADFSF